MNSHQSTTKRSISDVTSLQNHGMLTRSKTRGNDMVKRRKLETNPLKIPHIVEKILSFLDVKSIKVARQVKKLWSVEGAKLLIAKCFIYIPMEISTRLTSKTKKCITNFSTFLSYKSNEVPMIPNIAVFDAHDVELWKAFRVLGEQVKNLRVALLDTEKDWMLNFLDLLPNLKYLDIDRDDLQKLSSNRRRQIITSIMSKAKKEQSSLVISSLVLKIENMEELEEIEKFCAYNNILIENLKLELFSPDLENVPNFESRILSLVSRLLTTNKNTLKQLSLEGCEIYLNLLDFPILTSLTEMNLLFVSQISDLACEFPPAFRFSEKIPNLKSIGIHHIDFDDENFYGNLLKNTGAAPSVKSVWCSDDYSDVSIDPLFKTFPNIEVFQTAPGYSEKMFDSLWKHGQKLKRIYLIISLDEIYGNFADLDSRLTGFSQKTVDWNNLILDWNPGRITHAFNNAEMSRVNPSILMLKELENFNICVEGRGRNKPPKRMLAVAGEFAFKLMPKNVKIHIKVTDVEPGLECARESLGQVSTLSNVTCEFEERDPDSDLDDDASTDDSSDDSSDESQGFYDSDYSDLADM